MEDNGSVVPKKRNRKKTVFHFLDYRQYLQELYSQLKKTNDSFSYRAFARLADSTSPNFLQLITAGKLRISDKQAEALSKSVKLKEKELIYFKALIDFDHADSHDEKNGAFRKIASMRETRTVCQLANFQYDYLANWYNPVIRELVTSSSYPDDPQWLVDKIVPEIGLREVNKSVKTLQELGLIRRNSDDSGWDAVDNTVSTPDEVLSIAVVEYHHQMLERAAESLELFRSIHRDLRSVTMGISKEKLPELKKRMTSFWKEIIEFADQEEDAEIVVQVNTQLFPFTAVEENEGDK